MINLDDATNVLRYLKIPKPGEDRDNYIKRVGINTAATVFRDTYGKPIEDWVGGTIGEYTTEAIGKGVGKGAVAGVLSGAGALLSGASGEKALKSAGKSAVTTGVSGGVRSAASGLGAGAAGALGGAAAPLTKMVMGEEVEAFDVAQGAAIGGMTSAAGLGAMASTGVGLAMAIPGIAGAFSRARDEKTADIPLTYNPETGKLEQTGRGGKFATQSWKDMPEARKKVTDMLAAETKRRFAEFDKYTKGWSAEDKKALATNVGSKYFAPSVSLNSDDITQIQNEKFGGDKIKTSQQYFDESGYTNFDPTDYLNKAKRYKEAGLSGQAEIDKARLGYREFMDPSSGDNTRSDAHKLQQINRGLDPTKLGVLDTDYGNVAKWAESERVADERKAEQAAILKAKEDEARDRGEQYSDPTWK